MGERRLVDVDDLTSVANHIRTKGGTSSTLEFPSGFNSAIDNIPSGSYFGSDYPILDGDSHFWVDLYFTKTVEITFVSSFTVTVDWGDNTTETLTGSSISHTYSDLGQYRIDISGEFDLVVSASQNVNFRQVCVFMELGNNLSTNTGGRAFFSNYNRLEKMCFNIGTNRSKVFGHELFSPCASLKECDFRSGTINVSGTFSKFQNCYSLTKIKSISNVSGIFEGTFDLQNGRSIDELDLRNLTITTIGDRALEGTSSLQKIYFPNTITSINYRAFNNDTQPMDIYVPWAEGEVANAPWGATNATIHYEWSDE